MAESRYDAIITLSMDSRVGVCGNMARVENIKTGEVGAWHQFDRQPEVVGFMSQKETGEVIFHYDDGSYRLAKYVPGTLVLTFQQRVFPQWKNDEP